MTEGHAKYPARVIRFRIIRFLHSEIPWHGRAAKARTESKGTESGNGWRAASEATLGADEIDVVNPLSLRRFIGTRRLGRKGLGRRPGAETGDTDANLAW